MCFRGIRIETIHKTNIVRNSSIEFLFVTALLSDKYEIRMFNMILKAVAVFFITTARLTRFKALDLQFPIWQFDDLDLV